MSPARDARRPLQRLLVTPHELVVSKPAGLASELPRDPKADSLATRLQAEGFDDLRLVHRLDAPACGLMVVARTADAAAHYSAEIAARRWHKFYVAEVAVGIDRAKQLTGDHKAYLSTEGRKAVVVRSGGKPSFLTVVHASPSPDRPGTSHVLIQLHTGRFHQIRVMLSALGAPLAGDELYGGPGIRPLYLEHTLLSARPFGVTGQQVWRTPAHDDRPAWTADLEAAVAAQASKLANAE